MNVFQRLTKTITNNSYILPIVLSGSFFIVYIVYILVGNWITAQKISPAPFPLVQSQYPFVLGSSTVQISAEAALVMDNATHVVLYQKNPTLRFSPASTTKIMTALTALMYYHMDDVLTIQSKSVEGSVIGFVSGQKVTFKNLLYGMLVFSGNDAAVAIAQNYSGGVDAFVAKMNANANAYQLYNTHFGDPAGLTDDDTYTTVIDLSRLAAIAIANQTIAQVVATKQFMVEALDGAKIPIKNRNILLGQYGVTGIKTGSTDGAKEVLVTSSVKNGHTFIIVVMRSDDRFADTITLLRGVVDQTTYQSMYP